MQTPRDFVDSLGRRAIADRLGVDVSAISHACRVGKMPAAWYMPLNLMAQEQGASPPPPALFAWRERKVRDAS